MSTSEKWTQIYVCACGHGRIFEHVDSPDNAYSRTTKQYEIVCSTCVKAWVWDPHREALRNIDPHMESKVLKISSLQAIPPSPK
jgi:hypothetical protein